MARSAFGRWGADLSGDEFARALAAAGALSTGLDLRDWATYLPDKPRPWIPPRVPPDDLDPRALSFAWGEALAQVTRPFRIEVDALGELRSPAWLLKELSRPAVGLDGVYLKLYRPAPVRWHWPVRFAILDNGRSHLREQFVSSPHWTFSQFAELVDVGYPGPIDLLIAPVRLRTAVSQILPLSVSASLVVVLEELDEPWTRAHSLVDALLIDTQAGALAFAPAGRDPGGWLAGVLEALAYDAGLDVALLHASRRFKLPAPALLAHTDLVTETRLGSIQSQLSTTIGSVMADGGVEGLDAIAETVDAVPQFEPDLAAEELDEIVEAEAVPSFEDDLAAEEVDDIADAFDELPPSAPHVDGATVLAEASAELNDALPQPEARFLQAQVYADAVEPGPEQRPVRVLRPTALHSIVVRIGPSARGWLTAAEPFPYEHLPRADQHRLQVVLTEPYLLDEPQTADILLGPTGPSTACTFWIRTRYEGRLEARLIVLHEGRVLQTGLLRGEITVEEVDDERALHFELEALVHHAADLDGRTRFDAAFILNHDREDVPRITLVAGEHVDITEPVELLKAVDEIRARLEKVVTAEAETAFEAESTRKLLVALARHGSLLYQTLLDRHGARLAGTERLQIVAVQPEAYLPLEFVYDRRPPSLDAKLCPNAKQALETGRCDDCPAHTDAAFVCPLGFWSLSKIIERHLHQRNGVAIDGDYRVQTAPTATRRRLGALTAALFGASTKVDDFRAGTTAEVATALETATGSAASRAKTWPEWVDGVRTSPTLLVVLPHTLRDETGLLALQIEKTEQLSVVDIGDTHVGAQGPIVVLLGCDTGDPQLAFHQFPAAFRRAGAAIVLATLTKVLGRHAGPVAAKLVVALGESARTRETTFGEVLRDVRRSLLAEGELTVLAVTAYGDADWILGPTNGG